MGNKCPQTRTLTNCNYKQVNRPPRRIRFAKQVDQFAGFSGRRHGRRKEMFRTFTLTLVGDPGTKCSFCRIFWETRILKIPNFPYKTASSLPKKVDFSHVSPKNQFVTKKICFHHMPQECISDLPDHVRTVPGPFWSGFGLETRPTQNVPFGPFCLLAPYK